MFTVEATRRAELSRASEAEAWMLDWCDQPEERAAEALEDATARISALKERMCKLGDRCGSEKLALHAQADLLSAATRKPGIVASDLDLVLHAMTTINVYKTTVKSRSGSMSSG